MQRPERSAPVYQGACFAANFHGAAAGSGITRSVTDFGRDVTDRYVEMRASLTGIYDQVAGTAATHRWYPDRRKEKATRIAAHGLRHCR